MTRTGRRPGETRTKAAITAAARRQFGERGFNETTIRSVADIIGTLNRAINTAFADPGMRSRFADIGGEPLAGLPGEFGRLISAETEKWARVVKFSGAKAD